MKKFSEINENIYDDILKRSQGSEQRQEDIRPHSKFWWQDIALDEPKKYTRDEVRSTNISYSLVHRIEKTLNISEPQFIDVFFKYEVWDLVIELSTAYNTKTYSISAHGPTSPWYENYSKLTLAQQRSIKQRLDEKTFYIYRRKHSGGTDYILTENSQEKGEKGILLKK